jgi:hypothetical protein
MNFLLGFSVHIWWMAILTSKSWRKTLLILNADILRGACCNWSVCKMRRWSKQPELPWLVYSITGEGPAPLRLNE